MFGTRFILGRQLCVCVCAWICKYVPFLLILLSFNVSSKLSREFLSLLPPPKHPKNTSPPNPFTHACSAIIEFILFFRVIGEKPSPLAIFMFMALQFKIWMTAAFWWGAFMTTTHTHTHTRVESHCIALWADKSFICHPFLSSLDDFIWIMPPGRDSSKNIKECPMC